MGRKSKLSDSDKVEVVLALLRQQEPAAVLARRYGVSEGSLYRWRDEFLQGGKSALCGKANGKAGSSPRVAELTAARSPVRSADPGDRTCCSTTPA